MPSFKNFAHTQFILRIPKPTVSFASKTVIITGANGGLGQETAKHIIQLGAGKVILACRTQARGEEAKRAIEKATKCPPSSMEVWELDLESASSIKSFVARAQTLSRVDVLISNAGVFPFSFHVVYGTERALAVNTIGTYLLAIQMIPKLRETGRKYGVVPHMTFVSSALYDMAKWPALGRDDDIFHWFQDESHTDRTNQYCLSKLLQLYIAIRLSAMVDPVGRGDAKGIVINSLDPCYLKTGLGGDAKGALRVFGKVFEFIAARTAEEGSRLVVQAAAAGRETHGLYMYAGAVQKYAPIALDEKKAAYVWESLRAKLEALQPGVMENLKE